MKRVFLDTNILLDIVTRDKNRHFPTDGIPVLSPEKFLNSFANE